MLPTLVCLLLLRPPPPPPPQPPWPQWHRAAPLGFSTRRASASRAACHPSRPPFSDHSPRNVTSRWPWRRWLALPLAHHRQRLTAKQGCCRLPRLMQRSSHKGFGSGQETPVRLRPPAPMSSPRWNSWANATLTSSVHMPTTAALRRGTSKPLSYVPWPPSTRRRQPLLVPPRTAMVGSQVLQQHPTLQRRTPAAFGMRSWAATPSGLIAASSGLRRQVRLPVWLRLLGRDVHPAAKSFARQAAARTLLLWLPSVSGIRVPLTSSGGPRTGPVLPRPLL